MNDQHLRSRGLGRRTLLGTGAALALSGGAAAQQGFPSRPIRLVVPFPPGGSSDALGRIVATQLSRRLGQPVVVENRAGAGGTTAVLQVAQGAADGYTIVQGAIGNIAFAPSLMNPAPFDPNTVAAPLAMVSSDFNVPHPVPWTRGCTMRRA
jgi:tripartite-type tricarboxylate transporter receptor subunit TctC